MSTELINQTVVTQVSNGATAAQTAVTTNVVDMQGFDAVTFIASLATVVDGSVLTLTVYENAANSNSGGTAVTNGATSPVTAATSSNTLLAVDVIRPSKRYVYATLTRTAQNATVNNIVAVQYRAKSVPTTQPASTIATATSTPEV